MKRRLVSVVLVILATLVALGKTAAQTHPDFSGTWTVDAAKSDPQPPPPTAGRGAGRGATAVPPNQLVIRQAADDVSIARGARNLTYHFDGTETFHFEAGEVRSTVAWDGDKLVVSWKRELFAGPTEGYVTTTGKDVYSLAGSVLTQESSTVSPKGTIRSKTVYTRS